MDLYVGTSGYSYKEWRGSFYPEKLPVSEMLAYYARHFRSVEINNTFYRMPTEKCLNEWSAQVPIDFSFVLKTSRRITHLKRLKGVEEEMSYLLSTMSALGGRLGPMLVQLPPNLKKDTAVLQAFLELLPPDWRAAFEFRNSSWHHEEVYEMLRQRDMALVATDGVPLVSSGSWGYLRLRRDRYGDADLQAWCSRLHRQDWGAAYVFFKHEDDGGGPELATRFIKTWEAGSG